MTIWFTSDLHFGHINLFERYQPNRNVLGSTIEEHDEALISHWNARVGPKDIIYFLGDLTLDSRPEHAVDLLKKLSGRIKIVAGNHDRWVKRVVKRELMPPHVNVIADDKTMKMVRFDGKSVILSHHPLEDWPGRAARPGREDQDWRSGRWHLHGHSHGNGPRLPGRLDVGWDAHNQILSLDDVRNILGA